MGLSRDTSFLAAGWLFLACSVSEGSCVVFKPVFVAWALEKL